MNIYEFFNTIADKLYPFGGQIAYDARIIECRINYGYEFYCKDLFYYREISHLLGAILAFGIYLLIKKYVSKRSAVISIICFTFYLLFQELYLHPNFGGQLLFKSLTDLAVFLIPLWFSIFYEIKIKKVISHFVRLHKLFVSFLKSDVASLCGGLIDFSVLTLAVLVLKLPVEISIIAGVSMGGITYFTIANFWAFKDTKRSLGAESWRFLIIWFASLVFNTLGTTLLYSLGLNILISRILTSLLVSLFWNFPLNRFWVFPPK
ncbi:hypothetical protein A2914_02675 [Candidatus Nomurabacteria bacterium RIFCSPLOWO2_01_FULL_41_21]|uniref:GtrA/DPMS transmembrane domain-containing protein n=2 Tax=Candidatus Nomuraibacteriota TaxID=1752729 RepID=A0A1F6V1E7_9BACT|nr:MAG: hypothetical protein A2733_00390 [Candidatus Nomurabacteria bacterium RIFCSPHIGHO2_01_FULL_40_20]OGI88898.1 MAG: hypothetical protein A2914_02675 [Candidatus Nomurabacteria bacterium RIFCSPLOWO2_01_FULL_41_21]